MKTQIDITKIRNSLRELDLLAFLKDKGIDFIESGKNVGQGWVGVNPCPSCNDQSNHCGLNISTKALNCWKCNLTGTLIKFLMMYYNIPNEDAMGMIEEFVDMEDSEKDIEDRVTKILKEESNFPSTKKAHNKPSMIRLPGEPITPQMIHDRPTLRTFLKRKNLTLDLCLKYELRYDWEKSLRLILPIQDKNRVTIAYQGRDVTGRALLRYITKPDGINLGTLLYNHHNIGKEKTAIVVEGILDCIRTVELVEKYFRKKSCSVVGCFTNKPTTEQLVALNYLGVSKLIVMLDNDSWHRYKAFSDLFLDIHPIILPYSKDPNSLTDQEFLGLNLERVL